jgi:hypothetical protein
VSVVRRNVVVSERISETSPSTRPVAAPAVANPIEQSSLSGHPTEREQEVGYELAACPCHHSVS